MMTEPNLRLIPSIPGLAAVVGARPAALNAEHAAVKVAASRGTHELLPEVETLVDDYIARALAQPPARAQRTYRPSKPHHDLCERGRSATAACTCLLLADARNYRRS